MALRFSEDEYKEYPDINLIPFIDILLVIIIFLVLTTTYNRYREIQIQLPSAKSEQAITENEKIEVLIFSDSMYQINQINFHSKNIADLQQALIKLHKDNNNSIVVLSADASAPHQSVLSALEAAQKTGFQKITFTTQLDSK